MYAIVGIRCDGLELRPGKVNKGEREREREFVHTHCCYEGLRERNRQIGRETEAEEGGRRRGAAEEFLYSHPYFRSRPIRGSDPFSLLTPSTSLIITDLSACASLSSHLICLHR